MRNIFYIFLVSFSLFLFPKISLSKNNTGAFLDKGKKIQVVELGTLSSKQAILNDPLLPVIVEHIQRKYGISTVILYGSRARGTATAKSDYNIMGFKKSGEPENYKEIFKGAYLDVSIYPQDPEDDDKSDLPPNLFWQEAVILSSSPREGIRFVETIKKAFNDLQQNTSKTRKNKIRMLAVNLRRGQINEIREHFYRHKFLYVSLLDYFPIRGLVYMGPRKSLEWLRKHDPLTYAAFNKALAPNAGTDALYALLERIAGRDLDAVQVKKDRQNSSKESQTKEKYTPSKDALLLDITRYVQTKYGVHTVILYGSRAQGIATPKSDYDIIALRDSTTSEESVRDLFKEVYLDLHFFPEGAEKDPDLISPPLGLVKGTIILSQKDDLGERFLKGVRKMYDEGFSATDEMKEKLVDDIKMGLWKIDNTLEGSFYPHMLLVNLLEHYFTFHNLHFIGPRESFSYLKKNDPLTYKAFEKALEPDAHIEAIKEVVSRVIAPYEKKGKTSQYVRAK